MILGFSDYEAQGRALARALGRPFERVEVHRFPDGESKVRLPAELPSEVVLCRSLDHPNDKLVELLLAAETARELGVRRLTLVAPYLCYMRQDIAFNPGEAVSQRIVGRHLGTLFDAVVTVDPHLHRIDRLEQAIPGATAVALSCAPAVGAFLHGLGGNPLLIGPDGESEQWVRAVAEPASLEYATAEKRRLGDHEVEITLPERRYDGREVVLIDDMASTGRTLMAVTHALKARGAGKVSCIVTHALHTEKAAGMLAEAGVEALWSSDTVAHPSNRIALAPLLADALRRL